MGRFISRRGKTYSSPKIGKRVTVVYRYVPQYRREFYEGLKTRLADAGIELNLIYGQPIGEDQMKSDAIDIDWGTRIRNRALTMGRRTICYQPAFLRARSADLVIVEQASKLLLNYLLLLNQMLGGSKLCLWGHGKNLQADGSWYSRLAELVKKRFTSQCHHFFAYTRSGADSVRALGLPSSRVTIVQNTLELGSLRDAHPRAQISSSSSVTMIDEHFTCAYVGSLYEEKRLDFLVAAGEVISSALPRFRLVVAGDGPLRWYVEREATHRRWLTFVGPSFGDRKVALLASSSLILNPGLVGLVVLDSFALGVPLVTAHFEKHSPEFDYLINDYNARVTTACVSDYSASVISLLSHEDERRRLVEGCSESADLYSMRNMITNFSDGIVAALGQSGGS